MRTVILILTILLVVCIVGIAHSANPPPVLNFSDITSGPATGLGDGLGSGVIVTVWGAYLGTPTITSGQPASGYSVKVNGTSAAYIYEWTNATVHSGHPADLYSYHKMQDIMFSIGAATTSGNIVVTTPNGSSTLPFTVRSGNIYFVCGGSGCAGGFSGQSASAAGSNGGSGVGSWSHPWSTADYALNSATGSGLPSGSTIYFGPGATVGRTSNYPLQVQSYDTSSTSPSTSPFSVISYPGATFVIQGTDNTGVGIFNQQGSVRPGGGTFFPMYFTISKTSIQGSLPCIQSSTGMRPVANECIDYPGYCTTTGETGAMGNGGVPNGGDYNSDMHFLGNYVHDLGASCAAGSLEKQNHTWYLSNRTGNKAPFGIEIGWNVTVNSHQNDGYHFYDEGACGDWLTPNTIHDNVANGIGGVGIAANYSCNTTGMGPYCNGPQNPYWFCTGSGTSGNNYISAPTYIVNNLIIDSGIAYTMQDGGQGYQIAANQAINVGQGGGQSGA